MINRILLAFVLSGCAAGSVVDPETLKLPPTEPQRPAPIQEGPKDPTPIPQSCKLIRTVWGGNCRLDEYKCEDGSYRLDGRCYPPDWAPPWENIPDPPPYRK